MTALHADGCAAPEARLDSQGVLRCGACKYIQPAPKRPVKLLSNHRCPVHQDTPVTWRGTGCSSCAAANLKSAAARKAKREATAPRDTEEMERYR